MNRFASVTAGLFVLLGASVAPAGIEFVITTDTNLNDNGGVDEFVAIPDDGTARTVYIWGTSTPTTTEVVFEFNFDLNTSGSGLSFSSPTIGSAFAMGFPDVDLSDLQFGWSAFLFPAVSIPTTSYTLFATIDVAIASGTTPGADTTIELAGPDFKVCADYTSC